MILLVGTKKAIVIAVRNGKIAQPNSGLAPRLVLRSVGVYTPPRSTPQLAHDYVLKHNAMVDFPHIADEKDLRALGVCIRACDPLSHRLIWSVLLNLKGCTVCLEALNGTLERMSLAVIPIYFGMGSGLGLD